MSFAWSCGVWCWCKASYECGGIQNDESIGGHPANELTPGCRDVFDGNGFLGVHFLNVFYVVSDDPERRGALTDDENARRIRHLDRAAAGMGDVEHGEYPSAPCDQS